MNLGLSTRRVSFANKARSFVAVFVFLSLATLLIPVISLYSAFYKKGNRALIWRRLCRRLIKILLKLSKVNIKVRGKACTDGSCVYAANHLSGIDGLILLTILDPDLIAITGPADYFPFPFSVWFRKMDYIDVQRSNIEKIKYKNSYSTFEAVKRSIKELKHGNSILIFPEGHISLDYHLQYFHSGAARISLGSNKKVIPVGVMGLDDVVIKEIFMQSGEIQVAFW